MSDWSQIGRLLDFCAAYYTTQLVRCAAFPFAAQTCDAAPEDAFSGRTFIRGCYGQLPAHPVPWKAEAVL